MLRTGLLTLPLCLSLVAQTAPKADPKAPKKAAPVAKTPKTEKENPEVQSARQGLTQALDAVHAAWFAAYKDINAVDLQGSLSIEVSAAAVNAKVDQLSQGQAKGGATKSGRANLRVKGTYFANADFQTELTGDFGNMIYTRTGNKGFLYSKEQNAYTTRVDMPPADAPLTYFAWFRQVLNDIKGVYVDSGAFKASMGKEESIGGRSLQTLVFNSPSGTYDPKKREQSMAESLGFWKRGRLEVLVDRTTHLPQRLNFSNDGQGVRTQMDFSYGPDNRLISITANNQSRGMEGPAFLKVSYGGDGLMSGLSGELNGQNRKVAFDLALAWAKGKKSAMLVPPPGAAKRGREELESMLLLSLAGQILDLQSKGLNLRSVPVSAPKQ